ncbi:CRISPR-associated protein Cas2 [Mycoplasma testudineum]|uniref:CRISPR-associated endoribonuclease Cas2 n=1 Tax=Mycoplasma testudineum TaxID=244584 RepID=A0A4R6IE74_9MOLU|nr:CRISPR-associated endonuclease Cas2 [Mycoplasma testudineum]OYD26791.1 CRISPR-associated endonuclease Cas2 [Mycoplasma testudineum]TDO19927.1 CRISPR-associated protein Cas2 [Mycoplasma testudineum]
MKRDIYMRIMLFYDVAMSTPEAVKEYTQFHKSIIRRGYIMIQNSVYAKIITAGSKYKSELIYLEDKIPVNGNIRTILITDTQYYNMVMLRGNRLINEDINDTERYLKL